jgi:hypothetical protein
MATYHRYGRSRLTRGSFPPAAKAWAGLRASEGGTGAGVRRRPSTVGRQEAGRRARCHTQNENRNLRHDPWTARSFRRERPLPGDQLPVPSRDRVGRHDRRDLPQDPSAESATLRREASAVVVGQLEVAPLHPRLEGAGVLCQVLDDVWLLAVDPSRAGHAQHLQGVKIDHHRPILLGLTPERVWGKGSAEYSDISKHVGRVKSSRLTA